MSIMCFMLIGRPVSNTHTHARFSLTRLHALRSVPASFWPINLPEFPCHDPPISPLPLAHPFSRRAGLRPAVTLLDRQEEGKCSQRVSVLVLMVENRSVCVCVRARARACVCVWLCLGVFKASATCADLRN